MQRTRRGVFDRRHSLFLVWGIADVSSSPAGLSQSCAGGAYAAFSSSDFWFFFLARLSNSFGTNIMIPALGWKVYALTRSPLDVWSRSLVVRV